MDAVGKGRVRGWLRSLMILGALGIGACTERLPHGGRFEPAAPPRDPAGAAKPVWPVRGALVSAFRPATRPDHQGVDLAAAPGTTVVSALAGSVGFAGRIPGYGNVVAIEHGGHLTTVYSHLDDDVAVGPRARVAAGEPIGRVGPGGYLHFEIRKEKTAVDPAGLFAEPPSAPGEAVRTKADVGAEPRERVPLGEAPPVAAATPPPTPPPPPTPAPRAEPLPADRPSPATPPGAEEPRDEGPVPTEERASLAAGLFVSNFFWVPAKLAYTVAGGVVGGFAYALTGGAVTDVWQQAIGGDYFVTTDHLRGNAPLRFRGSTSSR